MNKSINIKQILSKELKLNYDFYENEKYLGISLNDNEKIFFLIKFLKEHKQLLFDQITDITAVDYPSREKRFDLVYLLLSLRLNERILVRMSLNESENIQSISTIHHASNWYERECYDLFGINFINHPDLRRIMTDYNFEGHPLRKDFPLTGHNEVKYDDLEKKVIYDDVKLNQEYRDFDYSSPWEGLENTLIGDEKAKKESSK